MGWVELIIKLMTDLLEIIFITITIIITVAFFASLFTSSFAATKFIIVAFDTHITKLKDLLKIPDSDCDSDFKVYIKVLLVIISLTIIFIIHAG
jgi:hypothetical protein